MPRIQATTIGLILSCSVAAAQDAADTHNAAQQSSFVAVTVDRPAVPIIGEEVDDAHEADLDRLFAMYNDARAAGLLQEADAIGKQIVEASIRIYGLDNKHTAAALTNLATLQTANDDNEAAIQNFAAAVGILERIDGRLSEDLIGPLKAMGATQLQAGQVDHALATWSRAPHITHVNYGPHDYSQVETLYDLARLYSRAGMNKQAERTWKRIYYLRARASDSDS